MRRIVCCARAATGHAPAAPPSSVMNSRRLMGSLPPGQGHTLPQCGERFRSTPGKTFVSALGTSVPEAGMAASTTTPYRSNRSRSSHQRRIEDD